MKKNFIFVGVLEALGHRISVRDGILKIIRGSLVVMKGILRNNLYCLMVVRLQRE